MSQQLTGLVQASHLAGTVTLDCVCAQEGCVIRLGGLTVQCINPVPLWNHISLASDAIDEHLCGSPPSTG